MAIILSHPHANIPERREHEHGTYEYRREEYLRIAGDALFAEFKNEKATRYVAEALTKWKLICAQRNRAAGFKTFCAQRRAILEQLDQNGGDIRRLLEKGVMALVGEQPQSKVDEAVEYLADRLNHIALAVEAEIGEFGPDY
jgi:hypothetical protein